MPLPATTGQLRTKISDMAIGDYIAFSYRSAQPSLDLGQGAGTEAPIAGQANMANTYWYMVKVAKGLLVADRTPYVSVSWDTLNNNRWIQGIPTSFNTNVALSKPVTGTNGFGSSNASIITDGLTTGYYVSNSTGTAGVTISDFIIVVDLGSVMEITDVRALLQTDSNTQWSTSAEIFYSVDNVSYTKFGTVTNPAAPNGVAISAAKDVVGAVSARYVKVVNFKLNSSYTRATINELQVYDNKGSGTVRSLTGGVAFVDANGNSSTTEQNLGAFPTNNEWDRYIVNFPTGKIQSGKTLDDIFHLISSVRSITQDTPILSIGASTNRVFRGLNTDFKRFATVLSSSATVNFGFRPVYEYKE